MKIPESECVFTFVRSSGPGGQNVNKVNSKAVLRWSLFKSPTIMALPDSVRMQILDVLAPRLTREGELLVASDRFRDQALNRSDCLGKLESILERAAYRAPPRKKTKPSRSAKRKRVESKRIHSEKKRLRSGRED